MSMNKNLINLATSPALGTGSVSSVIGNLAKDSSESVRNIKPKSYGFESVTGVLGSTNKKVNTLPGYKVTCNLHSVNSAKLLHCHLCRLIKGGFFIYALSSPP